MARNVAIIILYDQDKKILLQHRAEDAERLPGYWAFFGGGIEAGETPEQAVKRETLEELNYTLKNPKMIMKQDFLSKDETNEKHVFVEEFDPSKIITLGEGQNFGWFHLSEINKLKIIDHDIEVLKYIKDKY
ncbi:NUDIX domain-containing protein [Candidatus Uhrbacteria bacterium]|nr:NUDIX domain-containing protein [Candidatus Uhrbacteria bacterium]